MYKKFILLILMGLFINSLVFTQTDYSTNYFLSKEKQLEQLDDDATKSNIPIEEVSGYKNFSRWDAAYYNKCDENGDLDNYIQAIVDFYENNNQNSTTVTPEWSYISHDSLITDFDGNYQQSEGQQGWINRIWVNPSDSNHIIAGTHNNGLWLTFDHGNNWVCITNNEPMIKGIASLEVDIETNMIYICSVRDEYSYGGYTTGLYSTTDNGQTWNLNAVKVNNIDTYPTSSSSDKAVKWLIHPVHKDTMYLVTLGKFLRSYDGGDNWEVLIDNNYPFWHNNLGFKDMEFVTNDPSKLFLSGVHVYEVTNNGDSIVDITLDITEYSDQQDTINKIVIGVHENFPTKVWFSVWTFSRDNSLVVLNTTTNNVDSLWADNESGSTGVINEWKLQCEVMQSGNQIFLGGVGHKLYNNGVIYDMPEGSMPDNFVHVDIRDGQFININGREKLFVGCDGGVFTWDYNSATDYSKWTYITNDGSNGIRNSELHGFAASESEIDILYAGFQDMHSAMSHYGDWFTFGYGDGQRGIISPHDPYLVISSYNKGGSSPATIEKSFNGGEDRDEMGDSNQAGWMGLAFHPVDSNTLYMGDTLSLRKYTSIYDNDYFNHVYTIEPDTFHFDLSVREIAVNPNYPEMVYFATDRWLPSYYNIPPANAKAFFRSDWGGEDAIDLSAGLLDGLEGGMITGIASDPNENDNVWVSFGCASYDDNNPQKKKRVYFSDDKGLTWTAKVDSLPKNIPVNDIQFDPITGVLFLANDVGVYFFNNGTDSWELINNNLPPVLCDFIRINPTLNKLRVGTYGRGIWESSPCIYMPDFSDTITTMVTWNEDKTLFGDIIVENGGYLKITSTIKFPTNAKLIIKPGGEVFLDGGTLTNACENEFWGGIQVWGHPSNLDGFLHVKNNAIIENAYTAIANFSSPNFNSGGDLWIDGSVFKNNFNSISFNGLNDNNYLFECDFITDTNYFSDDFTFIKLIEAESPPINVCTFTNSNEMHTGTGIYAIASSVKVQNNSNIFENLLYGIKGISYATPLDGSFIKDAVFNNNYRAIYISGINEIEIHENDFNIPPNDPFIINGQETYGLYLENTTGYLIEENHFKSHDVANKGTVGLYIKDSGPYDNMVYLNTFDTLIYATVAYGENRSNSLGSKAKGLCYKCNTFMGNDYDISVPLSKAGEGIKPNQGSGGPDPDDPAGNLFSLTGPTGTPTDINNLSSQFTYHHHLASYNAHLEPEYYTTSTVTLDPNGQAVYDPEDSCPQSSGGGRGGDSGGDFEGLLSKMESYETEVNSIKETLDVLVDGGDTEGTQQNVETSFPPESYEVYSDLMNKSPYLSSEVVDASIEKDDVLPNVMIRDVMVANPQSSKDDELLNKLDDRSEPLPDYMLAQILQGRSLVGYLEELTTDKSSYELKRSLALSSLMNLILEDENLTNVQKANELISLLSAENTLSAHYRLAMLYLEKSDFISGTNILNDIPLNFELSDDQNIEYNLFSAYYQIMIDYKQSGLELSDSQLNDLQSIVQAQNGLASAYARNLLINNNAFEYFEPVILPDFSKSAEAEQQYQEIMQSLEDHHYMKLHPNPANDHVVIEYELVKIPTAIGSDIEIRLFDSQGILHQSIEINQTEDQIIIGTENYSSGVYFISLFVNNSEMDNLKFTIIK